MHLPLSLLLFLYTLPSLATNEGDTFHERLKLRDLPDGKLSSTFSFTSRGRLVGEQWGDNVQFFPSRLLPRSLTSIIRAHNVAEMHLSMAAGRWEDDKWGWPPSNGSASGAEVWAWLDRPDQESTDKAWSALVNTLGGLFCTSLNRLDATRTTSPALTFRPDGDISPSRHHLRHGLLPLEKPCTENFTPFLALLPCRSAAGLAFLLKPHRIFDADWQRLGVNILRRGDNYEIALDVEIVFDPVRLDRNKGGLGKRDWRFSSLFERTIGKACPVAATSEVVLTGLDELTASALDTRLWRVDGDIARFYVHSDLPPTDAGQSWIHESEFEYPSTFSPPPISMKRLLAGYGQERGTIGIEVVNNLDAPVDAVYVESWPCVIILTSTALALFFGSVFNMLTRRFILLSPRPALGVKSVKSD